MNEVKSQVPDNKAQAVPTMFGGIIFAKRAVIGSYVKATLIAPRNVSVAITNPKSFNPIKVFHLFANAC